MFLFTYNIPWKKTFILDFQMTLDFQMIFTFII